MVVSGLLLAGGLTRWVATSFSRLPHEVWLYAQVALGLGLVLFGLFCRTHTDVQAVPYFAAIALTSEASLTASEWLSGLLGYNLAFAVPLLMVVAVHRVYRLRFDVSPPAY